MTREVQRRLLDQLRTKNQAHQADRAENSDLTARIASYELAFHMQQNAPEAVDFSQETPATLDLYGINEPRTEDFGRKCLLARRLVERGCVSFRLFRGRPQRRQLGRAQRPVANHSKHAGNTDRPIAGLLKTCVNAACWIRR